MVRARETVLMRILAVCGISLAICFGADLKAQDDPAPASRAEQIENEQSLKAKTLSPDVPESSPQWFERPAEKAHDFLQKSRIQIQLGGLPMPAQLAVGPAFKWQNADGKVRGAIWGAAWIHWFYGVGAGLELPRASRQRLDVRFEAAHLDLPQLDFYGEGPQSLKSNRTNYRREDTRFGFQIDRQAIHVQPHCNADQLLLNVGPGTSGSITSTNVRFSDTQAPGVDAQTNFFISGCGLKLDFRDMPEYPRKGAALFLDYRNFAAEKLSRNSFNRATASIQEYVPFFSMTRVIALHAAADMTFHNSDQVVPFYMQPTLGGFSDLRGFRPLRFYDENAAVANVEYRWEIFTGLDMAVFGDAGEVFHRPAQFNWSYIQSDVGFGLRFNNQRTVVVRTDIGFSREGFYAWVVFGKVF
jgi:hypothetical protein